MIKSPDQLLKERIMNAIKGKGLLSENSLKKLEGYMARGVTTEDWGILADAQMHEEEKNVEK